MKKIGSTIVVLGSSLSIATMLSPEALMLFSSDSTKLVFLGICISILGIGLRGFGK